MNRGFVRILKFVNENIRPKKFWKKPYFSSFGPQKASLSREREILVRLASRQNRTVSPEKWGQKVRKNYGNALMDAF